MQVTVNLREQGIPPHQRSIIFNPPVLSQDLQINRHYTDRGVSPSTMIFHNRFDPNQKSSTVDELIDRTCNRIPIMSVTVTQGMDAHDSEMHIQGQIDLNELPHNVRDKYMEAYKHTQQDPNGPACIVCDIRFVANNTDHSLAMTDANGRTLPTGKTYTERGMQAKQLTFQGELVGSDQANEKYLVSYVSTQVFSENSAAVGMRRPFNHQWVPYPVPDQVILPSVSTSKFMVITGGEEKDATAMLHNAQMRQYADSLFAKSRTLSARYPEKHSQMSIIMPPFVFMHPTIARESKKRVEQVQYNGQVHHHRDGALVQPHSGTAHPHVNQRIRSWLDALQLVSQKALDNFMQTQHQTQRHMQRRVTSAMDAEDAKRMHSTSKHNPMHRRIHDTRDGNPYHATPLHPKPRHNTPHHGNQPMRSYPTPTPY